MPTIVLSHSSSDAKAVQALSAALQARGYRTLPEDHGDGDCRILIWSGNAQRSPSSQSRAHSAIKAWTANRLVLATLDRTPLPVGLRDLEAIDLAAPRAEQRLIEAVAAIAGPAVGSAETPDTMAAPPTIGASAPPPPPAARAADRPTTGSPPVAPYRELPAASAPMPAARGGTGPAKAAIALLAIGIGLAVLWAFAGASAPSPLWIGIAALAAANVVLITRLRGARAARRVTVRPGRPRAAGAPAEHDLFVSYSRKDERVVDRLVRELEHAGFKVWIDRSAVGGSTRFAGQIVQAIRQARVVVLMCSRNSFNSDHVLREVYVAGDCRRPIVSLELDGSAPPDDFLYFTSGFPRLPVAGLASGALKSTLARFV